MGRGKSATRLLAVLSLLLLLLLYAACCLCCSCCSCMLSLCFRCCLCCSCLQELLSTSRVEMFSAWIKRSEPHIRTTFFLSLSQFANKQMQGTYRRLHAHRDTYEESVSLSPSPLEPPALLPLAIAAATVGPHRVPNLPWNWPYVARAAIIQGPL